VSNVLGGRLLREPCYADDGCPESEEPFDGGEYHRGRYSSAVEKE